MIPWRSYSYLLLSLLVGPALAQTPPPYSDVRIDQRLGAELPLSTPFRSDDDHAVALGEFFRSRPVVLALVYYRCPRLCQLSIDGLVDSLRPLSLEPGRDFEVVLVSIDPAESSGVGHARATEAVHRYGRPWTRPGGHFLTGERQAIDRLAAAVGFHYAFDPAAGQYVHASAVFVATPSGRLSRYFYGVDYAPRDLRLGLVEASEGRIGSPVDELLLLCFHYDPSTGRYTLAVLGLLRALGVATVFGVAVGIVRSLRRERARG